MQLALHPALLRVALPPLKTLTVYGVARWLSATWVIGWLAMRSTS